MKRILGAFTLLVVMGLAIVAVQISGASATAEWQQGGYGFRILTYTDYDFVNNKSVGREVSKVASLSGWRLEFDDDNLPRFSAYPLLGLREDVSLPYVSPGYQMPPTLGLMRPADFPAGFAEPPQSAGDWAYREFIYTYGSGAEFRLLLSRLTPAMLLTATAEEVRLFDGPKQGISGPSTSWQQVTGGSVPGNPAHFAIPTAGGVQVREPGAGSAVDLSGLNEKWFLMWFGEGTYLWGGNSVIFPGRGPSGNTIYDPSRWLQPVDMPVLVVLEKVPQSLRVVAEGGVEVGFGAGNAAGQVALMPLLGNKYPAAADTELWAAGLPAEVVASSRWWYQRLGQFPVSVSETFTVDPATHDLTISDDFTFRSLGHGTPFAPVSPVLALAAQEGLPISFDAPLADSSLPLAIGPYKGLDNQTSYTYQIGGLSKYGLERRIVNDTPTEPVWLRNRLMTQLDEVVNAGHLAPWWPSFGKAMIFNDSAIWSYPWETPYYLGQTLPVLDDARAPEVNNYVRSERAAYPHESYERTVEWSNQIQTIPYDEGARREAHKVLLSDKPDVLRDPYSRLGVRSLMTIYALADYYLQTNEIGELQSRWPAIKALVDPYLNHSDWSTFTATPYIWPTGGREMLQGGIGETDRLVAGSIGLLRLARLAGDDEAANLGLYLLNKALVSRFAQDKLVKYLYDTGLQTIPNDSAWLREMSLAGGETGEAILWREQWDGYEDDVRRPLRFDQFGPYLSYSIPPASRPQLLAYQHLTPELGRFLRDYTLAEAQNWYGAVAENSPAWYRAYADAFLGKEIPFSLPHNAYQIFLVNAWILGESPATLATYTDGPWVHRGDYYYIHKLAEAVKAYRGTTWQTVP